MIKSLLSKREFRVVKYINSTAGETPSTTEPRMTKTQLGISSRLLTLGHSLVRAIDI